MTSHLRLEATPVLDIGGTHVTAARVANSTVVEQYRGPLDADADADAIISQIATIASHLTGLTPGSRWGVAIPGPFDYVRGVGDFSTVEKFQSLGGFDVGAALRTVLPGRPDRVAFVNDAEAYALGEWDVRGRPERLICITLGTGVGSGFIAGGALITASLEVPVDGNIHNEQWDGRPLERAVSREAIRRTFAAACGGTADIDEITLLARTGDQRAGRVLCETMVVLGNVLARWVDRFRPDAVVVGGSMSRSWDVLSPGLLAGLAQSNVHGPHPTPAQLVDTAPLVGAAIIATRTTNQFATGIEGGLR